MRTDIPDALGPHWAVNARGEDGFDAFVKPGSVVLRVIASWGMGWDHASVSLRHRPPSWDELEWVKRELWEPDEWVMQLHAPESEHINVHDNVLHLWRPQQERIPTPPRLMV